MVAVCVSLLVLASDIFLLLAPLLTVEENISSLVCSTEGGKVLIYTPRSTVDQPVSDIAEGSSELRTLSINGKITGIKAGRLNADLPHDILAIGMETTVRAYDVVMNSDQYFVSVCCLPTLYAYRYDYLKPFISNITYFSLRNLFSVRLYIIFMNILNIT